MMRLSWFKGVVVALFLVSLNCFAIDYVIYDFDNSADGLAANTLAKGLRATLKDIKNPPEDYNNATIYIILKDSSKKEEIKDNCEKAIDCTLVPLKGDRYAIAKQTESIIREIASTLPTTTSRTSAGIPPWPAVDTVQLIKNASADPVTAAVGDTTKTAPAGAATTAASSKVTVNIDCSGSSCPQQVDTGVSKSVNKASQAIDTTAQTTTPATGSGGGEVEMGASRQDAPAVNVEIRKIRR